MGRPRFPNLYPLIMTAILQNISQMAWEAYLAENSAAIFSHRYAWGETLATTYRLQIFRLVASKENDRISGILPLILFDPPDREKRLISLPYTDGAGIVADDARTCEQLLAAALVLAEEIGAAHVELRQAGDLAMTDPDGDLAARWSHTAHAFKTGLARPLPATQDELWSQLSAKVRNQVRKSRKCGCTVTTGGEELFARFFEVFSHNMRDLGSPVHAPELFRRLLAERSLQARLVLVHIDTQPAAAAMVFKHHGTLFNPWASSLRNRRSACPNMLLYWAMLAYGIGAGCRRFDFGRSSPKASTCRFKCQWGAKRQPLIWHVFSKRPATWNPLTESLVDNDWKTLDLPSSRRDGPGLRRWISL